MNVPQAELADLLGVSVRQLQRWLAPEGAGPSGGDEARVRVVAQIVHHLRHVFTAPGVLAWFRRPHPQAREAPTQYLALHPLGPAADVLRHHVGPGGVDAVDTVLLNLWAVLVAREDLLRIGFNTCADFSISPEALVGDDHRPTQALADRLRARGARGIIVPSAALPGTDNVVLFGPRVAHPYLRSPLTPEECPTGHLTDGARPAAEALSLVRWLGAPHPGLEHWRATGHGLDLDDPVPTRW